MKTTVPNVKAWIVEHDNRKSFVISYILLSLLLSVFLGLFWLLFAVLVHLVLEMVAQKQRSAEKNCILAGLWETKLDFGLVLFALWLAIYLDVLFGVAGIGAAARGGLQAGSRLANTGARMTGWVRVIRTALLTADECAIGVKAVVTGRKKKQGSSTESTTVTAVDSERWNAGDYIGLGVLFFSAAGVLLAPWLIGMSFGELALHIADEFHPW